MGQNSPDSLPCARARSGATISPRSTEPMITASAFTWHLTRSRSRRPHQGVSSHSVATKPARRKVRYSVPMTWPSGCRLDMKASTTSSDSRQRNTLGLIFSRRFTTMATIKAAGRDPWVINLPTTVGMCTISGKPFHVPAANVRTLRNSRPHVNPTPRRIQRSLAAGDPRPGHRGGSGPARPTGSSAGDPPGGVHLDGRDRADGCSAGAGPEAAGRRPGSRPPGRRRRAQPRLAASQPAGPSPRPR